MNVALLRKIIHDTRIHLIITIFAALGFPILFLNAISAFDLEAFQTIFRVPFVSNVISALGGFDPGEMMSASSLAGFVFVHPAILVLLWAFIIAVAIGRICGEIDQGTADILLALPISRWQIYTTTSMWVAVCTPVFSACLVIGLWIAQYLVGLEQPLDFGKLWLIVINQTAMLYAVIGIVFFASAIASRRGVATGWIIAVLVVTFVINWLAAVWPAIKPLSYVSVMTYFKPFVIVRDASIPTTDIIALLAIAIAFWLAGCLHFTRRDINVG